MEPLNMQNTMQGPKWDIFDEYSSCNDPLIASDLSDISEHLQQIENLTGELIFQEQPVYTNTAIQTAQRIASERNKASRLIGNLMTFSSCLTSVNGKDEEGQKLLNQAQHRSIQLGVLLQPLNLWFINITETVKEQFLSSEETKDEGFKISQWIKKKDTQLSNGEEKILKKMELNGPIAWGNLYDTVSSNGACRIRINGTIKTLGIAQSSSYLEHKEDEVRKEAWCAINQYWEEQQDTCSAGINSIAGWRLDNYETRSKSRKIHYLEEPLQLNCISKNTLDALMGAVEESQEIGQRVLRLQAKALGKTTLDPWDLFAPAPGSNKQQSQWSFADAIELIKQAFSNVSAEMSDFVDIMVTNRWIEGSDGKGKRPGAYCTKFPKSRNPRVYMTYSGGIKDVITLAHEIGHAFHNWVMRDLSITKSSYPMTLAETASIFAQTLVLEDLQKQCSADDLFSILWTDSREAEAFLLNIPARFDFEDSFYKARKNGIISPADLSKLMDDAWKKWYGNDLSQMNKIFWASKLHFHISGLSFYNFPYTFGYLFALGVYSQKEVNPDKFYSNYVSLLRDTGSMSAEDLAHKHLDVDITNKNFWLESIVMVGKKVDKFDQALNHYLVQ